MIDPTATHPLLRELNDALAIEGAEPVDWIVCGGTALGILGLVQRPTRDVDVISGWSSATLQIVQIDCFPPAVERAIVRVADAHSELKSPGITNAKPWVNLGPKGLLDFGLPPGCTERLTPRTIGTHLTLRLPDRRDLIAFKLFAAVDAAHGRQPVHKSDLRALAPNEEELREFLQELGHEDLAYYIA